MDSVLEVLRHHNYADNVFLMCKFWKGNPKFEILERTIRDICKKHHFNTLIADDPIRPDLWDNVKAHMLASSLGIAIFDKMDQQAPSVNVFIESGFMLGRGKDVLFLVEDTVPLPVDYGGKIVRRFDGSDSQTVRLSIEQELDSWLGSKRRRNFGR
ncbi:MAG: hypothetical protein ACKV22_23680 [Bryobacteraceae bacterium]